MRHKLEKKENSKWVTRFLDQIMILIQIRMVIISIIQLMLNDIINCICYGCNLYKNDMQGLVIKLRWQGYLIMN